MTTHRRLPRRIGRAATAGLATAGLMVPVAVTGSPPAWADDVVTYEVVSDSIAVASVEYQTIAGRAAADSVALPWRIDATVRSALGPPPEGSQVRADWRPSRDRGRDVTVRIIYQGRVVCQSTLDVGNATCYGVTPRIT